jgi:signal peptidase I
MSEAFKKSAARDTFESLVITVILAIFGTTFVLQAFKIPTGSMKDTLLIGDHLLVNKFVDANHSDAWWTHLLPYKTIRRGQVVVFRKPGTGGEGEEPGEHLVKRVIGVPGDHIRLVNRKVYVNGKPLDEPYVRNAYPDRMLACDNFPPPPGEELQGSTLTWSENIQNYVHDGEIVVPPHSYFVMGDNREESWDSRFWGFVPRQLISGRPLFIYWSYETPDNEYTLNSLSDRLSQSLDLVLHFFTKTRWRRTFRFVR